MSQNRKTVTNVRNKKSAICARNQISAWCPKQNPKDKPLASKSINRPQLFKSRYRLLESLIKYRPLISKIKDCSQVFQSIKRVQSKRWANTVQKKKKNSHFTKIINRPRVSKSKDRLLNSKIKKKTAHLSLKAIMSL